ncbi:molecular chaperone Hsp90 [Streptomyces sp. SL13]|uniref:Molecular chaperone Hsp90 n=1 Tax=Streptantibioticus silvisoli TaxID=2705255 RepID=A0AA90H3J2_9ACTN|nr:molecular chaperone Hsp90 [Streptantibioticus silvisoli]MDI5969602.1 molecular chaperone Hsp90 [Streptantibioticus silvisoli]
MTRTPAEVTVNVQTPTAGDPFGTGRVRSAVLAAWAASAARFREDANAEEDLALGGYRDRLVVELAQNAADAAVRAGVPGRFSLTLRDGVLTAANTGAPLDAEGVESLSTLRASAKRDAEAVGRFGVGFSAVMAVTDEPAVLSRSGGVRWSLTRARELALEAAAESPALAEELERRAGHLPSLRLPLPAEGNAPHGYDTAVVLPLRDEAAHGSTARMLAEIDDALLLALPALAEVTVETPDGVRKLTQRQVPDGVEIEDSAAGTTRWRVRTASGTLAPQLLADRPVEERSRLGWSVTWAVPVDAAGAPARPRTAPVVHAPTPTDEGLGLPALLIASFPLDPTRRHVADGPLAAYVTERAAETYAGLLAEWRPLTAGIIDLVPGPLGKGELDAALRGHLLEALPRIAFLPPAHEAAQGEPAQVEPGQEDDARGEESPALRPDRAELVEGAGDATVTVLAEVFPSLLPAGLERRVELRTLDVARLSLHDAIDRLAGAERPAEWWRRLYDALAGTDPDRLTGLPVPLADGRTVVGPRQILLPTADGALPPGLDRLGLRVVHADAAHPLLEKLGALPATARAVLTTPQVRAAVAASMDAGEVWDEDAPGLDPEELAELVLTLVRDAGLEPGDEPWLGALALPDDEGELAPASELVLPGSEFEQIIRPGELACCDNELADRWGEGPLTALGVLATFALVRGNDVVLDPDDLEPRDTDWAEPDDAGLLDAVDVWCEDVLDQLPETDVPPVATELVGVRDLDLVDDGAWPRALELLARPPLREAVTSPVRVLLPDGTTRSVRSFTAWWLRDHPVLDGRRPVGLRAAGGDPLLAGLYDEARTEDVDEQVLRALGVRTSVAALLDEPGGAAELLGRLADPDREVTPSQLHGLYARLSLLDPDAVTLPEDVRAVVDGECRVVDAADAVVADVPDLMPLAAGLPLLPAGPDHAAELADLFQVRRLSGTLAAPVVSHGEPHQVPAEVRDLLPGAPLEYLEHEELLVDGPGGEAELDWRWVDGTLHAATLEGVAAGLAWAAGAWQRRFEVAALLEDLDRGGELATARWFD